MNARAHSLVADDLVKVTVLDASAGFAAIAAEWQALSLAAERPSCFAAPSYFKAWRDTLADDVTPCLLVARRAGRLVGIMPLMRAHVRRGPRCAPRHDFAPSDRAFLGEGKQRPISLRQLSPVVSMPATWVGPAPLCLDADRADMIRAMAGHIATMPDWDSFALPVDADRNQDLWFEALHTVGLRPWVHVLDRHIGGIGVIEPFAAKVARQNWKFRQNIRRADAEAERAGMVVTVFEGHEAVAAQLPAIAAVAQDSWKQTGRDGVALTVPYAGRQQRFFEHLLTDPASRDGLTPVLAVAACGDRPVAVLLCLQHGDRLTALVTFRNDAVAPARPGLRVMARMIDWSHERGLAGFDLNATHEWTRHLIDETRSENIIVCFAPTLRGHMLQLISAAARRVR